MRSFNVFSELVVPYPGETFQWVVNQAEIPQGQTSVTVSSSQWCLQNPSYTVSPGSGTQALANGSGAGTFSCNPPAPEVQSQSIVLAAQTPIDICEDVAVEAGDYFIWQNDTNETVVITPDDTNAGYWPLPSQQHTVPPNDFLTLQIPQDANDGSFLLVIATENGSEVCSQAAQPKLIVGSGK